MAKKLISSLYKDFYAYSTSKNNPHKVTLAQIGTMSEDEINALAINYLEASPIGVGNITTLGMKFEGEEGGNTFKISEIKGIVNGIPIDWKGTFYRQYPPLGIRIMEITIKYKQYNDRIEITISDLGFEIHSATLRNDRVYTDQIPIFRLIIRDGIIKKIITRPVLKTINNRLVSVENVGGGIPASNENSEVSW